MCSLAIKRAHTSFPNLLVLTWFLAISKEQISPEDPFRGACSFTKQSALFHQKRKKNQSVSYLKFYVNKTEDYALFQSVSFLPLWFYGRFFLIQGFFLFFFWNCNSAIKTSSVHRGNSGKSLFKLNLMNSKSVWYLCPAVLLSLNYFSCTVSEFLM